MKKQLLALAGVLLAAGGMAQELFFEPAEPVNFQKLKDGRSFKMTADITKPFTVLVTFRMDPKAPYRDFKDFVSLGGERGPGFRITLHYGGIALRSGDGKKVMQLKTPATIRIHPGWNHIAVVSNGENSSIILNGKVVKTGNFQVTPPKGKTNLVLGTYPSGAGHPLRGAVSRFRFVPRVLTPEELADEYLNALD